MSIESRGGLIQLANNEVLKSVDSARRWKSICDADNPQSSVAMNVVGLPSRIRTL